MISLKVQGSNETLEFNPSAIVIAGLTARDQASVQRHIDELARQGITPPKATPMLYVATTDMLTQGHTIDVVEGSTSGEVEFVLITDDKDGVFITVGSDHTDRELEKADIAASKQVCPKVIGREAWRLTDVEGHWDRIEMRSWVAGAPYQEGLVSEFMSPKDIIRFASSRATGPVGSVVIFGGTLPLSTPSFVAGDFRAELKDPVSGRGLSIDYTVHVHSLAWKTNARG